MPTHSRFRALRVALLAGAALSAVSVPAASAAEISVPGKCYVYWPTVGAQPIPVNVTGLAASQNVQLSLLVKNQLVSGVPSLPADGNGSILGGAVGNWTSGLGDGPTRSTKASIAINDVATGEALGSTSFKVANVGFKIDGSKKRANVKRTWEISGLASWGESGGGGKVYYAYYFSGDKQVGKQRLGKAQDACGYLKAKKVLIPFKKSGVFDMKIQASRTWKGDDLPWIGGVVQSSITYG